MVENYKIIHGEKTTVYEAEIEEKKSKFIAQIKKVETEEEAVSFIKEIKKKHYNATHNCSAFVIGKGKELIRSNDDGEPSGTAGKPMLEVLLGSQVVNVVAVVTRYYGGTLLGTGGLIRAYTNATKEGIARCKIAQMSLGKRMKIHTDYNTIGKILHELSIRNLNQEDSEYTDVIVLTVIVSVEAADNLVDTITEISAGKSTVEIIEETYFPIIEA